MNKLTAIFLLSLAIISLTTLSSDVVASPVGGSKPIGCQPPYPMTGCNDYCTPYCNCNGFQGSCIDANTCLCC